MSGGGRYEGGKGTDIEGRCHDPFPELSHI